MRVGLTRQSAASRRKARHDRHGAGHGGGNGAATHPTPDEREAGDGRPGDIELGPVQMSRPERAAPSRSLEDERRVRAAGGPEDRAHYSCRCGYAFEASVSTSVECPHCGAGQAW